MKKTGHASLGVGAFDVVKGLGMLMIFLTHSMGYYDMSGPSPLGFVYSMIHGVFAASLMIMFFMISGYGFRKRPDKKCVAQQAKAILIPFYYTGLAASMMSLMVLLLDQGNLFFAVKGAIKTAVSFALALQFPRVILGRYIESCGNGWFLMALFLNSCLLNWLMNHVPEKWMWSAVLAFALLAAAPFLRNVFCIDVALYYMLFLFLGYKLKESKLLASGKFGKKWNVFFGLVILFLSVYVGIQLLGPENHMVWGTWGHSFGVAGPILGALCAVGFMNWSIRIHSCDSALVDALEYLGRNSILLLCVHTAESIALPLDKFAAHFSDRPVLGCTLHFGIHIFLAVLGTIVIRNRWTIIQELFHSHDEM